MQNYLEKINTFSLCNCLYLRNLGGMLAVKVQLLV